MKILRSDRGGEYTSNLFRSFYRAQGINLQLTTAYTPQQNGIAERNNYTILDMARSMVKTKHMPRTFWTETVLCAVYLLNGCPIKSVKNKTPNEVWSGSKPLVGHLRIFGCIAYAHIPEQKRKKLDDKGVKCIFTRYDKKSKAYKLYNPLTKKLIISRDVEFDELDYWIWSEEERKVVGLFFNNDDDDSDDSNIEDGGDDDPTRPQSPNEQTPASTPSGSSSSGGAPRNMRSLDDIYDAISQV